MFEFLLSEWHTTPDYIINNWSSELLEVMIDKLAERKEKLNTALSGKSPDRVVSDEVLFRQAGKKIKRM